MHYKVQGDVKYMKHKYLREIFPNGRFLFPYGEKDYPDFDSRDTFNMDTTLIMWLYERLRYFEDNVSKIVVMDDPKWSTFEVDGRRMTQMQCVKRMIRDCRIILTSDDFYDCEKRDAAKDDLFKVLSKVFWAMWW